MGYSNSKDSAIATGKAQMEFIRQNWQYFVKVDKWRLAERIKGIQEAMKRGASFTQTDLRNLDNGYELTMSAIGLEQVKPKSKFMEKQPVKCEWSYCGNEATLEAVFSLAYNASHPPVISSPIIRICERHKNVTFEELMGNNWERICKEFIARKKQAPTKEHSKLIIRPITK